MSEDYCNLAFISRKALHDAVETMWPAGAAGLREQVLGTYIDTANLKLEDADAQPKGVVTDYRLKQTLLKKYGLRADNDNSLTVQDVHDGLGSRLDTLTHRLDHFGSRFERVERLLEELCDQKTTAGHGG